MNHDPVVRRQVEIRNALGLHLRPAQKFVTTADRFRADIRVWHKGRSFDGRSILDLATLAAECGTLLDLEASGADAEEALAALVELIASDFFEDEYGQEIPAPAANGPLPGNAPTVPGVAPVPGSAEAGGPPAADRPQEPTP
jgi:phosphocarrier protein